jgi:hypothetical protein
LEGSMRGGKLNYDGVNTLMVVNPFLLKYHLLECIKDIFPLGIKCIPF